MNTSMVSDHNTSGTDLNKMNPSAILRNNQKLIRNPNQAAGYNSNAGKSFESFHGSFNDEDAL